MAESMGQLNSRGCWKHMDLNDCKLIPAGLDISPLQWTPIKKYFFILMLVCFLLIYSGEVINMDGLGE